MKMPIVGNDELARRAGRPGLMPTSGGTSNRQHPGEPPAQVKIRFSASANHGKPAGDEMILSCQKVSRVVLENTLAGMRLHDLHRARRPQRKRCFL